MATDEQDYRAHVATFLAARDDATTPEQGWPWPWNDSRLTDCAYAFDTGLVWATHFAREWFVAADRAPEGYDEAPEVAVFPDMSARKNVIYGPRSGVILIGRAPEDGAS